MNWYKKAQLNNRISLQEAIDNNLRDLKNNRYRRFKTGEKDEYGKDIIFYLHADRQALDNAKLYKEDKKYASGRNKKMS